jgi:hypothetical protein
MMSWKIEPKSGDEAWTWATVEGAGAAVGPAVELVWDWALVAALASPPALWEPTAGASGLVAGALMVA